MLIVSKPVKEHLPRQLDFSSVTRENVKASASDCTDQILATDLLAAATVY